MTDQTNDPGIRLSILVPSVHTRFDTFASEIQKELYRQLAGLTEYERSLVEVLVLTDTKRRSIGKKRNEMLWLAQGEYVVFVDDDDRIEPDYILTLLNAALGSGADALCFDVSVSINGAAPKPCYYSRQYEKDFNNAHGYYRLPNHIMCVKRSLAKAAGFPETQRGEDSAYARRLAPYLRSEYRIGRVLYHYDFNSETTETQK